MTRCVRCLAEVDLEQFLRNDHVCDPCGDLPITEQYRFRSNTPDQQAAIAAMEER